MENKIVYRVPSVKEQRKMLREITWSDLLTKYGDLIPKFYPTTYPKHLQTLYASEMRKRQQQL